MTKSSNQKSNPVLELDFWKTQWFKMVKNDEVYMAEKNNQTVFREEKSKIQVGNRANIV